MSATDKTFWDTIRKRTRSLYDQSDIDRDYFRQEFGKIVNIEKIKASDVVSMLTWAFEKKLSANEENVTVANQSSERIESLLQQIQEKQSQLESAKKLPESDNKTQLLNQIQRIWCKSQKLFQR